MKQQKHSMISARKCHQWIDKLDSSTDYCTSGQTRQNLISLLLESQVDTSAMTSALCEQVSARVFVGQRRH
jgi:hypothetical protein